VQPPDHPAHQHGHADGLHLPLPVDSDVDWEPVVGPPQPHLAPPVVAAVFVGGCAGGLARYGLTLALPASSTEWPWAVLIANVAGSFLLGLLLVLLLERWPSSTLVRPLLGTGFCGGFTTMSSVVVATDRLLADGHGVLALAYVATTAVTGLAAAGAGLLVGRTFVGRG
jgi:CrcB protein